MLVKIERYKRCVINLVSYIKIQLYNLYTINATIVKIGNIPSNSNIGIII